MTGQLLPDRCPGFHPAAGFHWITKRPMRTFPTSHTRGWQGNPSRITMSYDYAYNSQ